jgi:predicted CoA-substrate-specific enzyme activase
MKQYYVGIDIGSTASKVAVLCDGALADAFVLPTGWNGRETARQIYGMLQQKGYTDNMRCVATGYGRISVPYADKAVTEITCHGRGACYVHGTENLTVIDIGGQDTKLILVEDGMVKDFIMNDKCSAGTGRFLEVMAAILQMDVSDLEKQAALTEETLEISSTCTVFAESEVISQLAKGAEIPALIRGICRSVAVRTAALARRAGIEEQVCMSGGVAGNGGVRQALEKELGVTIRYSPLAQLAGALGAAHYAMDRAEKGVIGHE